MKRCSLLLLLLSVLIPTSALAVAISVEGSDLNQTVQLWLGEQSTVTVNVTLTARGGDVKAFSSVPLDLAPTDKANRPISRDQVTIAGDATLKANVPKNFAIRIGAPERPGTYKGAVRMIFPPGVQPAEQVVRITLKASNRPVLNVAQVSQGLQPRLFKCQVRWTGDCWLGRNLLTNTRDSDWFRMSLTNTQLRPVIVTAFEPSVRSEQAGNMLPQGVVQVTGPEGGEFPQGDTEITVKLDRSQLAPGRYMGNVHLEMPGSVSVQQVPVAFSLRAGPVWPLLALVVGVGLGIFLRFLKRRRPQADARRRADALKIRVRNEVSEEDRPELVRQIDEKLRDINANRLTGISDALDKIESRINPLVKLRGMLEHMHNASNSKARVAREKLLLAIGLWRGGNSLEQARSCEDDATKAYLEWENDPTPDAAEQQVAAPGSAMLAAVATDTGVRVLTYVLQPAVHVLSAVFLVWLGFQQLYLDKDVAFGAGGITDYVALSVWGLTADFAGAGASSVFGSRDA